MMRSFIFILLLILFSASIIPAYAHSGCCFHHGGVNGCQCADGTSLSNTCLPYYPKCSGPSSSGQSVTTAPATAISTVQVTQITSTPAPTVKPASTTAPMPAPLPQDNFFTWLFGLFFGPQQAQKSSPSTNQSATKYPNAGLENGNSQCKADHINPDDPQAYLPDPKCTPGSTNPDVTQANIQSTICVDGFTKTIRPPVSYTNQLKLRQIQEYGFTDMNLHDYEEDHMMPLEIGGNPTDPKNLWPEPHPSTNEKDKVEDYLHRQVCSGKMTLQQAQQEISTNWYAVYHQQFKY